MARTRYRPAPVPAPIVGVDLLVREEPFEGGQWIIELFVDGLKVKTLDRGDTMDIMKARAGDLTADYPGARIKVDEHSGAYVRSGFGLPRDSQKGARLRQG